MPSVILEESGTGRRRLEFQDGQADALLHLLTADTAEYKVYVTHTPSGPREFQGKLTFLRLALETEAVGHPELSRPAFVPGLPRATPEPAPVPRKAAASDLAKWVGVGVICLFAIVLFGILPSAESKSVQPGKSVVVKSEPKQAKTTEAESEAVATLQRDLRDLAALVRAQQDKQPVLKSTPNPSETAKALGDLISPVATRIGDKLDGIRSLLHECKLALTKPASVQAEPVKPRRPAVDFLVPYVEQGQLGVYVFGDDKRAWDYRPDGRVTEFVEFDDAATDRNVCRRLRVASEDRVADRYVRVTFLDGQAVASKYEHFGEPQVLHKVAVRATPDHPILAARKKAPAQDEPRYVPQSHHQGLLEALARSNNAVDELADKIVSSSSTIGNGWAGSYYGAKIKEQCDRSRKTVQEYTSRPLSR